MISVICVWNNEVQYQKILIDSLQKQNCDYELISIDNRNQAFSSCDTALNWGADHSQGDVLVFVHQDITTTSLKEFGIFITNHPDMVVGAYGAKQKGEICEAPYLCETVDECCFEMTCECFNRLRFNEEYFEIEPRQSTILFKIIMQTATSIANLLKHKNVNTSEIL